MQYFFFSSLFIRLVFINHSGKTELILKSLLHSFPPFIMKGEFSSSFQIHPEIQVFLLFQLQCTVGVLDLDGERFRFLHRYNFSLDIYTLWTPPNPWNYIHSLLFIFDHYPWLLGFSKIFAKIYIIFYLSIHLFIQLNTHKKGSILNCHRASNRLPLL